MTLKHHTELLVICFLILGLAASRGDAGEGLRLEQQEETLVVTSDGKLVTKYHFGKSAPKPYFHPVNVTGSDVSIVRPIMELPADGKYPKQYDHKHHRGIWLGLEKVDEHDHWMEKDAIVNREILIEASSGPSVIFVARNDWLDGEGKALLEEESRWTIGENGLWVVDVTLTSKQERLMIGDTKEGFLGIRMDDDLRGQSGGLMVNAQGQSGEKECWGKAAAWVDYTGERDGKRIGVSLFDDPANFREGLYHVRNYGLFAISPFGPGAYSNGQEPEQPVVLTSKKPLKLRYGLYVHTGSAEQAKVGEIYAEFVGR